MTSDLQEPSPSSLAIMLANSVNHTQEQAFFSVVEEFVGRLDLTDFEEEPKTLVEILNKRKGRQICEVLKRDPLFVSRIAERFDEDAFELIQSFGDEIAKISWDDHAPGQCGYARVVELCGIYIYEASHAPSDGPDRDVKPMIKRLNLFGGPDMKSWISADYDHLID